MALLQLCFSYKGRITNRTFRRHLFRVVIFLVICYISLTLFYPLKPIIVLVCFVVAYTTIPAGVKRLHDLNHPGWLILVGIVPVAVGVYLDSTVGHIITFTGSMCIGPYLCLGGGTAGDNYYGPSPTHERNITILSNKDLRKFKKQTRQIQRQFCKSFDENPKDIALQYLHQFQNLHREHGTQYSREALYELTVKEVIAERFKNFDIAAEMDSHPDIPLLPSDEFVQATLTNAQLHREYDRNPFRAVVAVALIGHKSLARGGEIVGWGSTLLKATLIGIAQKFIPPGI